MVRKEAVIGVVFSKPPIFRTSCSLLRLWMKDPEHKNRRALKNE